MHFEGRIEMTWEIYFTLTGGNQNKMAVKVR